MEIGEMIMESNLKQAAERAAAARRSFEKILGRHMTDDNYLDRLENLADDVVLPVMVEYPGDKLTLKEIAQLIGKHENRYPAGVDIERALDLLERGGEVISFEAERGEQRGAAMFDGKPKRWCCHAGRRDSHEIPV
jgi:hypothetical protein